MLSTQSEVFTFTAERNREVRSFRIPARVWDAGGHVQVTFQPRCYAAPNTLDPTIQDDRPLGMAINRMRLLPAAD